MMSSSAFKPVGSLPYRPDIDGLRAISVLAVIFFHAQVPGFAGGYVGVDVFFVISGYLITQVLMAPSEHGLARQLGNFYLRRCRRILPALSVMLITAAVLAYLLFLPSDLARFGRQLGFTLAFLGNWAAWRTAGYFDLDAPSGPFFHLWSIAVEEQFYVVFPLVLLAAGRALRRRPLSVLAAAMFASFALCVWASYYEPRGNFFFAPTRAWELLLGSLVALGIGHSLSTHRAREAFAGAALLAILGCIVLYDERMRYPGVYAVVPCVGAAILLAAATTSVPRVSRWISMKPLVFTGLISYSLYLWHLPVFAFAGYYNVRPLNAWQVAVLVLGTYVLSAVSWRYVETPVRGRKLLARDRRFLIAAGGFTALLGAVGFVMWQSEGLPGRLSAPDATLIENRNRLQRDQITCVGRSLNAVANGKLCRYGADHGASADVLLWGDSHALALLPAYERIAAARNMRLHAAWFSGCRPLMDPEAALDTAPLAEPPTCRDFNRAMLSAIDAIDADLVILNAYWTYPNLEIPTPLHGASAPGAAPFELALERTLRAVDAKASKICVIGGVPTLEYRMPYAYAIARRRGVDTAFIALPRSSAHAQHRALDRYLVELGQRNDFTFVDPKETLCSGSACAIVSADGRSLYRDNNHLAAAGAYLLSDALEACFEGVG